MTVHASGFLAMGILAAIGIALVIIAGTSLGRVDRAGKETDK